MRIPFLDRFTARKLTVKTTGPHAARIATTLQAILTQLPDLQLLYLADNRTADVLAFYSKAAMLIPGPLAKDAAALYRRPPRAVGHPTGTASPLHEAVYVFGEQLHFSCACPQAEWHWGVLVPLPDVSLALVRAVLREHNRAF